MKIGLVAQGEYRATAERVLSKKRHHHFSKSFLLIHTQVPSSDKKSPPTIRIFNGICKSSRLQRVWELLENAVWVGVELIAAAKTTEVCFDRQWGCPGKKKKKETGSVIIKQ